MANVVGGGNAVQNYCGIEPDGFGEGSRGSIRCDLSPDGDNADRGEDPKGQENTPCRHCTDVGGPEACATDCKGQRKAACQETLTALYNVAMFYRWHILPDLG